MAKDHNKITQNENWKIQKLIQNSNKYYHSAQTILK